MMSVGVIVRDHEKNALANMYSFNPYNSYESMCGIEDGRIQLKFGYYEYNIGGQCYGNSKYVVNGMTTFKLI
jgi:hypothetical protein